MAAKHPAHYLHEMAKFARRLRAEDLDAAAFAAAKCYVRVNGGGLRLVSLGTENPCGALPGHATRKTAAGYRDVLGNLPASAPARNGKPEHRLQAALIEHALRWPGSLPALLHLSDACDAICFVTDEMSLPASNAGGVERPAIRADMVLAGHRDGRWFPIFIELKAGRAKKRLEVQLSGIVAAVQDDAATRAAFEDFLRAAIGRDDARIDLAGGLRMMIWPRTGDRPRPLDALLADGIRVLEFPAEDPVADVFTRPGLPFSPVQARPATKAPGP